MWNCGLIFLFRLLSSLSRRWGVDSNLQTTTPVSGSLNERVTYVVVVATFGREG